MATIQDVAKAAGVAASTVSRYLNGQLHVSPATEARLRDAVETLGYVPNAQAKNLARRRSGVIGFVVPEMSNPYFGTIADQVVEAVERRGLMVLLCSTHSQAVKESSYIDLLASGAIDGMLYLGSFRSNQRLAAAICDALAKGGIDPAEQISLAGHFTEQFGASALPRLLAAPHPPTAAFVASDYIALGMLSAAETHGVRVPEDLSVVGFDDIRFSQYVRPRLTTVRSPVERLAQTGVQLLFDRLAGTAGPARTEVLPVELIVRESAGPPAAAASPRSPFPRRRRIPAQRPGPLRRRPLLPRPPSPHLPRPPHPHPPRPPPPNRPRP